MQELTKPAPSSEPVTQLLGRFLGGLGDRDDTLARLIGAVVAAGVIALCGVLVGDRYEFLSLSLVLAYLVIAPLVALVPMRYFVIAQAIAAVVMYVAARLHDQLEPWEAIALAGEQVLWFFLLWRAPLERIGVRRAIIATTTIAIAPICWWMNVHHGTPIECFLGAWRQLVLLVVLTANPKANRTAIATVRNIAMPFFMPTPVPLENVDAPDRRVVTLLAGGVIFGIGLVSAALFKAHVNLVPLDWNDGIPWFAVSCIIHMLAITVRVGAFGCMLMGHCYLLGIRIPAPIVNPLLWTNLGVAWRGTGVYMYRFAYDGFYRQFFPHADRTAAGTMAKIVALFAMVGYVHGSWDGAQLSWTAAACWLALGISTGFTVIYLRRSADARMRAYMRDRKRPARSPWSYALAPLCVAAVIGFRGLIDYGLVRKDFAHNLGVLLGIPW